jgi:type IV secretion system protein VirD4
MPKFTFIQSALVLAYAGVATIAAPYLAAAVFFLINKTIPAELFWETWFDYWAVYGADPLQRKRLLAAAGVALGLILGTPLLLILKTLTRGRSLHGDARWATEREIGAVELL